ALPICEEDTGRGAISAVVEFEPDLVVLDWMLPDLAGIDVGRRLRERGFRTAILFLTAKDGVADKVEALRAGGDDYVTKPFSLAEVVARVEAILRRTDPRPAAEVLRFADVTLDENRHEVHRGDTRVELTATEYALLRYFLHNPRRVLSKGQILQNVWKYDFAGNSNVVETYVSYLRRKLDALGLAVADAATYVSLRSFQIDQVDAALAAGHVQVEHMAYPPTHGFGGSGDSDRSSADAPPAQGIDWYAVTTLGGQVVFKHRLVGDDPPPKLPRHVNIPAKASHGRERVAYFTVHATSGDDSYRVRASIDPLRP